MSANPAIEIKDGVAHSEIGASGHYRWKACPGSVRLSRGLPNRSSDFAEEGTDAHTVAAALLEGKPWPVDVPYDEEMEAAVRVYVDYVASIFGREGFAGSILIEHAFDLSSIYKGLFGTADCVIYDASKRKLYVLDYKHGQGIPVEAFGNTQLLYYGLGALVTLPYEVEEAELGIIQPRCNHPDGPIRTWQVNVTRLFDFAFEVYEDATRTEDRNAPLVPGGHCRFCKASGICPSLHAQSTEVARREFGSHLSYDPVLLSDTLQKLEAVEAWAKGVKAFAYNELEHGREIPGWKLVEKRANRSWRDEESAVEKLSSIVPKDSLFKSKLQSPAQVEKLLPKEHRKILADLVAKESSGYALAEASDPRPPAKVSPHDEFTAIGENQNDKTE